MKHAEGSRTVPLITQAELKEYVEQVPLCRRHEKLRRSIIDRLDGGAAVEPGELSGLLEVEQKKIWSWGSLNEVLGAEAAEAIWAKLRPTKYRRLSIVDQQGNPRGWIRAMEPTQETSDAETQTTSTGS